MPKMHWCTCSVNLAGQGFTVTQFYPSDPISWPEAQVLQAIHGEENVFDIKPCGVADASPTDEKRRLFGKYGGIVEKVFPGRVFRMQMQMPGETVDQQEMSDDGVVVSGSGVPDDEIEHPREPPVGPAVFKPGKIQPPHKGA